MFPDEQAATEWFESQVWPEGRHCPRCGCTDTREAAKTAGLPYYCTGCQKPFSARIGTTLERSKISIRKWVFAIYLHMTNLKGVSSMKLHRDLKVTQKTSWFMLHRIRETWGTGRQELFHGPVEVDETYIGGKRKNMNKDRRAELTGRGGVGKTIIAGAKDRKTNNVVALPVPNTRTPTLQGFVADHAAPGATVYTDDAYGYKGMPFDHESVNHSGGEYVRGDASTQGVESFWSMFKRGYTGTYHYLSRKHMHRYVREFAGRYNIRELDTIDQMGAVVAGSAGKRFMYRDLAA